MKVQAYIHSIETILFNYKETLSVAENHLTNGRLEAIIVPEVSHYPFYAGGINIDSVDNSNNPTNNPINSENIESITIAFTQYIARHFKTEWALAIIGENNKFQHDSDIIGGWIVIQYKSDTMLSMRIIGERNDVKAEAFFIEHALKLLLSHMTG